MPWPWDAEQKPPATLPWRIRPTARLAPQSRMPKARPIDHLRVKGTHPLLTKPMLGQVSGLMRQMEVSQPAVAVPTQRSAARTPAVQIAVIAPMARFATAGIADFGNARMSAARPTMSAITSSAYPRTGRPPVIRHHASTNTTSAEATCAFPVDASPTRIAASAPASTAFVRIDARLTTTA